jgi:thiamine kinase-like enzyme
MTLFVIVGHMSEENLTTNSTHPVIRIGDSVHRPVAWWSPAVHDLLKHLEKVGFGYAPRFLGLDNKGREVLSYIEGETGSKGNWRPIWQKITNEEGLHKFAKLLRAYHDAVADYKPSAGSEWASGAKELQPGEIICHGDFGVWNIIWQGNNPVGIVDWDMAHPAKPEHDILYALEYAAPFRDDDNILKWHHFTSIPDRKDRIAIFLDAYGTGPISNIADKVAGVQRKVNTRMKYLAQRELQPQADWVANGALEATEARAKWTEQNKQLFE